MESRILKLISALRTSGVRISLAESAEAFSAVDLLGIQDRESFRLSLRSTLIKDSRDFPVFDKFFPLFFGSGQPPIMGNPAAELTPDEAWMLAQAIRQLSNNLRAQIERLLNGEPLSQVELENLGLMVSLDRIDDFRFQNWITQRMLRALEFPEVRKAISQLMDQLAQLGMNRQRVNRIRKLIQQNMQGTEQQINRFAGERIAEKLDSHPLQARLDGLHQRPFLALSDTEKRLLQHEVKRMAAALRTRIALRQKHSRNGQLDPKATLRTNLKYHGVPMVIRHRDRIRKPRLVVLCDISTSMRFCSELMLSFLYALQGQISKTYAFAFIDHLEFISPEFNRNDPDKAIADILLSMPSGYYNTDLGGSLENFNRAYLDTLNGQTTLLIVGDGRNNYNDPRLDVFKLLARRAARTLWLNPEPPALWHGDSDMPRYAAYCDHVLRVSNLKELNNAVDQLLSS